MFEGFRSRWMMPFWCACWRATQTRAKSHEARVHGEAVVVAEFRDRHAVDEFHHEKRAPGIGGAGVEHARDVRMVHHRERLALGLETGDDLPRVHAELDDLQRDAAPHRCGLLGEVNDAAAALADFAHERVAADHVAGFFLGERGHRRKRRALDGGGFEKRAGGVVAREQGVDAGAQRGIAGAGAVEKGRAVGEGQLDGFGEDFVVAVQEAGSGVMGSVRKKCRKGAMTSRGGVGQRTKTAAGANRGGVSLR
jgi:hypothetical protein